MAVSKYRPNTAFIMMWMDRDHPDNCPEYENLGDLKKKHHAGLIVRSPRLDRVNELLDNYGQRFVEDFVAVAPPPERPE